MPSISLRSVAVESIIAVRVNLDSGRRRYFLTWGRLGSEEPWPGDIEKAVMEHARAYELGGEPVSAVVCDSLQEAAGERWFFEELFAMQREMPPAGKRFDTWAAKASAQTLDGRHLHYCGIPKPVQEEPANARARLGFVLDCFDRDGHLVSEHELDGMTPERLQEIVGDDDLDRVMCRTHALSGEALSAVVAERDIEVDETAFDYWVTPWADPGYRTPRGYQPPPRVRPAFREDVPAGSSAG